MKQLKNMKETLVAATQAQLTNLENVNTQELGCAIDMIKDLSEAIYYCSITKSMEEAKEEQEKQMEMAKYQQQQQQQNGGQQMYSEEPRRMYYTEPRANPNTNSSMNQQTSRSSNGSNTRNYQEFEYYPNPYGGRSTERRRTYMESKHSNDKATSMKELEHYAQDLTSDVIEMIEGATLEEKQMLAKKLTILANKIQNSNV